MTTATKKRTKHVFTNSELPHIWMHQGQEDGRTSNGAFYFEGKTIYSYGSHFPIASHITSPTGEAAVLFTTGSYGHTTAQHKSLVLRSIPNETPIFTVPFIETGWRRTADQLHQGNIDHFKYEFKKAYDEAKSGRKFKKYDRLERAEDFYTAGLAYVEFFQLGAESLNEVNVILTDQYYTEKGEALGIKTEYESKANERYTARNAERIEAERLRQIQWNLDNAEKIERATLDWFAGFQNSYFYCLQPTMLRVKDGEVETTRGAKFPVEHAKLALKLIKSVVSAGVEWKSNGHTCKLGHYEIQKITAEGTVYAGCHIVTYPEIDRIAADIEGA